MSEYSLGKYVPGEGQETEIQVRCVILLTRPSHAVAKCCLAHREPARRARRAAPS